MTICDPSFPVLCDAKGCGYEEMVPCSYLVGGYQCEDSDVESHGWLVKDGDHFCSESCAEATK